MHAWTSAITADVYRSGIIVSKRMDILLGHNVNAGKGKSFAEEENKVKNNECKFFLTAAE